MKIIIFCSDLTDSLEPLRMTAKHSNALQTSQTCSLAKWCPTLHSNNALEAPGCCTNCDINSVLDGNLHPCLNQCRKTPWFVLCFYLWLCTCLYTARCFTKHPAYHACYIAVPKSGYCNFYDEVLMVGMVTGHMLRVKAVLFIMTDLLRNFTTEQ